MKASEVLLPGTVWAKWDYDWNAKDSRHKIIRSTMTVLAEEIDAEGIYFCKYRVRAIEHHANGVVNHLIWSPPDDEEGLRVMGYKRVL